MIKKIAFLFVLIPGFIIAQQLAPLTVNKIMRDPKWIGSSPSDIFWSPNGNQLYFKWNPNGAANDSLYSINLKNHTPQKISYSKSLWIEAMRKGSFNEDKTSFLFIKGNTLYLLAVKTQKREALYTTSGLRKPTFVNDYLLSFIKGNNLFTVNIKTHEIRQITDFRKGEKSASEKLNGQALFLQADALENSEVLREIKNKANQKEAFLRVHAQNSQAKTIYIGNQIITSLELSPNENEIVYQLMTDPSINSKVPNYVTKSGNIEFLNSRPLVGTPQPTFKDYIYNIKSDTIYPIKKSQIPGIKDIPKFIKEHYKKAYAKEQKANTNRSVYISHPFWNKEGTKSFVVIRAQDHKDRWIMSLDTKNGNLKLLNRQHDDAWIGGPGIGYPYEIGNVGWIDYQTIWFQSEKTGYSHLYTLNINTGETIALTSGKWEVWNAQLSPDNKTFYITSNQVEPSQRQFYHLNIKSKTLTRITGKIGGYEIVPSPNGKYLAELYSTSVNPWELFLQQNKKGAEEVQITDKAESESYQSYNWRKPDIITFKDRDDYDVYASVYKPKTPAKTHPGVIFVHGAGYLQDVQKFWSYYFREHMFINMLVDEGYTVMDIDYQGSAGYGRDWRTAVYRFMGGSDLADIEAGSEYMIEQLGVDPNNVGIWGGSYGGFMTLMAMFRTNIFTCGAALRSVTDWAHYNHDYTSDILNLPQNDSIAYLQSSPIYYADGLKGHLLMCHGMVDVNVHFQDIVRLTQRLIELGKDNWELAVYPVESHDFKHPSSWRDEYSRIYKLFNTYLKK